MHLLVFFASFLNGLIIYSFSLWSDRSSSALPRDGTFSSTTLVPVPSRAVVPTGIACSLLAPRQQEMLFPTTSIPPFPLALPLLPK